MILPCYDKSLQSTKSNFLQNTTLEIHAIYNSNLKTRNPDCTNSLVMNVTNIHCVYN